MALGEHPEPKWMDSMIWSGFDAPVSKKSAVKSQAIKPKPQMKKYLRFVKPLSVIAMQCPRSSSLSLGQFAEMDAIVSSVIMSPVYCKFKTSKHDNLLKTRQIPWGR